MARVTSKLQVTIPKAVADRYAIKPGTDVVFEPAGDIIRVLPPRRPVRGSGERLKLFDEVVARQQERQAYQDMAGGVDDRGWTRDELYDRGRTR